MRFIYLIKSKLRHLRDKIYVRLFVLKHQHDKDEDIPRYGIRRQNWTIVKHDDKEYLTWKCVVCYAINITDSPVSSNGNLFYMQKCKTWGCGFWGWFRLSGWDRGWFKHTPTIFEEANADMYAEDINKSPERSTDDDSKRNRTDVDSIVRPN